MEAGRVKTIKSLDVTLNMDITSVPLQTFTQCCFKKC